MQYLPGYKDSIEPPHECKCCLCNRPLTTGIGYFVIDEEGREFPTGPVCFKKLTGASATTAPILALGVVSEKDNPGGSETPTTRQFKKAARNPADTRIRTAQENVLLRAQILPQKGFTKTDARWFQEFLPRISALTASDLSEIERRVTVVVGRDERRALKQLKWCNTVYGQMQRLLGWEEGFAGTKAQVEIMRDHIRTYNGLLDKEVDKLGQWSKVAADKYSIANSIEGINFTANQARYDQFIKNKLG